MTALIFLLMAIAMMTASAGHREDNETRNRAGQKQVAEERITL